MGRGNRSGLPPQAEGLVGAGVASQLLVCPLVGRRHCRTAHHVQGAEGEGELDKGRRRRRLELGRLVEAAKGGGAPSPRPDYGIK